ncbi:FGGY-family carbohydrate kinase [Marinicrinis lubricantis]|uniref:L-fuculokinase n=1 Tax=Marinicrinis lubricantis TaxID=2086470 RepID=A0ABW1IRA4_9BACL
MYLLGIDIGTTHSKVGLFDEQGATIKVASRETMTHRHEEGYAFYDPEEIWGLIASAIQEVTGSVQAGEIKAIGITSMAEAGLLVDRDSGKPKSIFMPWFDTCSQDQAEHIKKETDLLERFSRSGLHISFKLGLAKILWLKEKFPESLENAYWLSASSYVLYKLTGAFAFDYSLAARTLAFRIDEKRWDEEWIRHFNIDPNLFPPAYPAGDIMGHTGDAASSLGLAAGTPVSIAGHDHVAAALSVGAIRPEVVYDSMGTAETLVGTLEEKTLGAKEYAAGMSFGVHIAKNRMFWMGGNTSSGGSVEWLRTLLADDQLTYEKLLQLLTQVKEAPTGILYYPYLAGSGAPNPDALTRASFIGLGKAHGKPDLIKAVLEGTAYQLQAIREEAEEITGRDIHSLVVVGGGTRNPHWLQVKADVLNCRLHIPPIPEASLLGAALAAGIGAGMYKDAEEAAAALAPGEMNTIEPNGQRHAVYQTLYMNGYKALQQPLRAYFQSNK